MRRQPFAARPGISTVVSGRASSGSLRHRLFLVISRLTVKSANPKGGDVDAFETACIDENGRRMVRRSADYRYAADWTKVLTACHGAPRVGAEARALPIVSDNGGPRRATPPE
jgi:hypothetical protein